MNLKDKNIGFAITGSFCTFNKVIEEIQKLKNEGANIFPILSYNTYNIDTKFGKTDEFVNTIEEITGNKIINTISEAEPIGRKKLLDILIIAPCSGNTIAKLAHDIIDTPVTMRCKITSSKRKTCSNCNFYK